MQAYTTPAQYKAEYEANKASYKPGSVYLRDLLSNIDTARAALPHLADEYDEVRMVIEADAHEPCSCEKFEETVVVGGQSGVLGNAVRGVRIPTQDGRRVVVCGICGGVSIELR